MNARLASSCLETVRKCVILVTNLTFIVTDDIFPLFLASFTQKNVSRNFSLVHRANVLFKTNVSLTGLVNTGYLKFTVRQLLYVFAQTK